MPAHDLPAIEVPAIEVPAIEVPAIEVPAIEVPAIEVIGLTKAFRGKPALDIPVLVVASGEMVALIGASGSGKSTLLRHMAGLMLGDGGEVRVHGRAVQAGGRLARDVRRVRAGVGVVFQQFNLVGRLPVLTNVLVGSMSRLPLWRTLPGWFPAHERARARQALARVGIEALAEQRASTLSGGQQQGAAIARTLVQGAQVILADEPIASLDPESSRRVMETLAALNQADGITVVVSLHQVEAAVQHCRRVVALRAGRIVFDGAPAALTPAVLAEIYGEAAPPLRSGVQPVPGCRPLPESQPMPEDQPMKERPMLDLTRRIALLAVLALPFAPARAQPQELNFGIVSTEGTQNLRSQWAPFLEDMQRAIGIKVNGFYPSDYAGVIEAMRFNKVQVAWYGNASAIQAVDRAQGEVFAQKTYADGTKGYYSLLIVNKDSPYHSLAELLKAPPGTLNFGNGDPNSTSGFLIPSYYAWAKNGIDVRKFFKNVVGANHEANLLAVASKTVDVATNNTEDFAKFEKAQPARAAIIREIWRSPIIPADPIVCRQDLDDKVKEKVRDFFLSYGTERANADVAHERKVLADLGGWGNFVASSNAQLLPVRQVAVFRERLATEASTTLDAAEKTKKLAEIDARLKQLDAEMNKSGS